MKTWDELVVWLNKRLWNESYFASNVDPTRNKSKLDFVKDRRRVNELTARNWMRHVRDYRMFVVLVVYQLLLLIYSVMKRFVC
jgi:hypothetical protein